MVNRSDKKNRAVAEHISKLTAELAKLANAARYTDLTYALEIARLEAEQICGRNLAKPPEPPDPTRDNIVFLRTRNA